MEHKPVYIPIQSPDHIPPLYPTQLIVHTPALNLLLISCQSAQIHPLTYFTLQQITSLTSLLVLNLLKQ